MGFFYCTTRTSGGDPKNKLTPQFIISVLPARAGVIPNKSTKQSRLISTTRTSGGDPMPCFDMPDFGLYYPHERG